ncbi:MAG: hypothetical protein MUC62_02670 [Candidatus Thermoplasmatota archaeon]|jgi:hypothetical protein|nr:hypothetical protein [Candidatus Thermoplasmatota archaeon]
MFGLGEILLGKKKLVTYSHLKSLHYSYDCQGLVESIDDAPQSVLPFSLQFLNDLATLGWSDKILSSGLKQRLAKVLASDDRVSHKEAVLLISTLVSQGKGRELLDGDLCLDLLTILEWGDEATRTHLTYIITDMISLGYSSLLIEKGGLDALMGQLGTEEPSLQVQTLAALQALALSGSQAALDRTEVMDRVKELRMVDDPNVCQYADSFYYALTGWSDRTGQDQGIYGAKTSDYVSFTESESVKKKESVLKDRKEEERYVRPARAAPKVRKERVGKLRSDGSRFEHADVNDTVLVLGAPETDRTADGKAGSETVEEEIVIRPKKKAIINEDDAVNDDFEIEA